MERIYARNCTVGSVTLEEAQTFMVNHHRQGSAKIATKLVSLGLFNDGTGELVAVVQFCYPRTVEKQRKYSIELLRLAFKANVRVLGGASKLITHYKKVYRPSDIFTYQDMTGEATEVYLHAGFTLALKNGAKKYLVAPGKTLKTGSRKEVLGMAYATRYGPDRILGTKLGEIIDGETGKRKSNQRIFLEELGWHIEETLGDSVYEWFNPNVTFYTYRITASDSDKYYHGVSHVKTGHASKLECLADGYYGSGGIKSKFSHWKTKHVNNLEKTVLQTFASKGEAYEAERTLIGESWKTDPLCLNGCRGGKLTALESLRASPVTVKDCAVHGPTKFTGDSCFKCASKRGFSKQECSIHGVVVHRGNNCCLCLGQASVSVGVCDIHGETAFRKESCFKCTSKKSKTLKNCPVHGKVWHRGNSCCQCATQATVANKDCRVHGITKHQGNTCCKCVAVSKETLKECPIHGMSKHHGDSCRKCVAIKAFSVKKCEIHGEVIHQGEICKACSTKALVIMKVCVVHGEAPHQGKTCRRCVSTLTDKMKICEIHGETLHRGDKCFKCSNQKAVNLRTCLVHGDVKHQGEKCSKCTNEKLIKEKICAIHGLTKHRGATCYMCMTDKKRHNKNHQAMDPACRFCSRLPG